MKISVEVEKAYSIPPYFLIIAIFLLALTALFIVLFILNLKRNKNNKKKELPPSKREKIRAKYLGEINKLEQDFYNGRITLRELNEGLSKSTREFVQKMTGQETTKMTLSDLRKASGLIGLSYAVALFYQPEFAPHSDTGVQKIINAAREVVVKWI